MGAAVVVGQAEVGVLSLKRRRSWGVGGRLEVWGERDEHWDGEGLGGVGTDLW